MVRRLLAVGLPAVFLCTAVPEASAGGPTSVVVVNPATEETGSLYTSEDDYRQLQGALEPAKNGATRDLGRGGPGTSAINVTWLIHDVTVWRVDRVIVKDDQVWVQTTDALGSDSDDLWQGAGKAWHQPRNPRVVLAVFDRLRVLDSSADAQLTTHDDAMVAEPTDNARIGANWWWALPGLALGVGLGALGWPRVGGWLSNRERGPRHQLIDT